MSPMAPNNESVGDIFPAVSTSFPKDLSSIQSGGGGRPTVAVIGAGMSGLRAAQVLLQKGYKVVVYEARDRLGGRIFTSDRLGKDVDLGPNWIHGTDNNPILPLSEISSSKLHHFSEVCPVYGFDGRLLNQAEADELQDLLWKVIERAVEYSKYCYSAIPVEKSFFDYCVEKAEELFGPNEVEDESPRERSGVFSGGGRGGVKRSGEEHIRWKGEEERKKEIWLSMAEMWGTFIGSPVTRQSLKFFFLEEPLEGANLFVASTYKAMIETMAKPSLDAGVIKLNTPIDEIIAPSPAGTRNRVLLKSSLKPHENREVDAVIVTVPLGCLKRDMIRFDPKLPSRMLEGIHSLSYGTLEKVYIRFPSAFWDADGLEFFTFLSPRYAPKTNPQRWHMACFSLARLPEPCAQPTLLFYIFGPISAHLVEKFPPPTTEAGRQQYVGFFRPYFSRLPGYREGSSDCVPVEIEATQWSKDKWAGYGSYSNFQVGLHSGEEDIKCLRAGTADRMLWFAGEHTSPVLGLGSVSGAYWSGEDAAARVIGRFESSVGSPSGVRANERCQAAGPDPRDGTINGNGPKASWYGKTVGPAAEASSSGEIPQTAGFMRGTGVTN